MSREVLEVKPNLWVHESDLLRQVGGREDSEELRSQCVRFLHTRHSRLVALGSLRIAHRAATEVVVARMKASAVSKQGDVALRDQLRQAESVIDRLLAFVPPRAKQVGSSRMQEIVATIRRAVRAAFPTSEWSSADVFEENDAATAACHRIAVNVELPPDARPEEAADGIVAVHASFVAAVSPAELLAIHLDVEPVLQVRT